MDSDGESLSDDGAALDAAGLFGDSAMLHDVDRNSKYAQAIRAAVAQAGGDAAVLDIGTGTGLLSLVAAEAGAQHVYACEVRRGRPEGLCDGLLGVLPQMAEIAQECIARNKQQHAVHLRPMASTALKIGRDLPSKMKVLVSEIVDSQLLGEGILPTLRHAMTSLMEENATIVPISATIWAQVVQCETLWNWEHMPSWLQTSEDVTACGGSGLLHDIQIDMLADAVTPLCAPVVAFEFDLRHIPSAGAHQRSVPLTMTATGKPHAIVMWWDMHLTKDICISTRPVWIDPSRREPWRDHWMPCVQILPQARTAEQGQSATLHCWHNDYDVSFGLQLKEDEEPSRLPQRCTCGLHMQADRHHVGWLNDESRIRKLFVAVDRVMASRPQGAKLSCLCLGRFNVGALHVLDPLAVERVVVVDSSTLARNAVLEFGQQRGLRIEVASSLDEVQQGTFDLVLLEPFSGGIEPWQGINTLVELSGLSLDAPAVLPAHFRVCACIIECPSLHEPRQRVGTVCGVDLSAFDAHVTDVAPELLELQGFLWEQPDVKVLCEPKVLWQHSTWPLSRSDLQQRLTASFDIVRDGALHAAVLWPEYLYEGTRAATAPPELPLASHQRLTFLVARSGRKLSAGSQLSAAINLNLVKLASPEDDGLELEFL